MSNLVTGWEVEKVKQIVSETLDTIVDPMVYEEALDLIAHHRMLGHQIIIISSSGTDVVEPIGERLGADLAIGTQVGIEDGKYTGEILFYAYGPGKAEAMRSLAAERGYDLTECYAYSDSFTDVPMLEAVGHPVAVNPDTELRKVAVENHWPIRDFAKPVAMKSRIDKKQAAAAGAGVALGAVALGIAWYARRRSLRA
jgi:HAD superfamily hydrolase (TIGR01490 family)